MQQLAQLWAGLDTRRRIIILAATVIAFGSVLALARMAASPNMSLLYAGLESGSAGGVVTALEQQGVAYEIRGDSIFVDASRRDELRMILAGEGLPANASKGYEILDGLSGFGTTSQMFDAAYWRAKEGELARTIISHPSVSSARVHIATTGANPFQRDVEASASVSVVTVAGGLTPAHARALRFLVASAVTGLSTDNVAIIDSNGDLIGAADTAPANAATDRAEAIRKSVRRLLEARVGQGNVVVEVSVESETSTEHIRQKRIDPESRVAISTDTEERSNTASDTGNGGVTVASNLPEGDGAQGEASNSETSETRERVNYEISETQREITRAPGATRRLTVAVLVNGTVAADENGAETFLPRSEEEIEALRELVASAVGFDEARGDVITIKSLRFEPLRIGGTDAAPSLLDSLALDAMALIQALVLGVVALVLGLFVIRPMLLGNASDRRLPMLAPPPADGPDGVSASGPLTGEIQDDDPNAPVMRAIGGDRNAEAAENTLPSPTRPSDQQVQRLRDLIGERQDETVEILRSWLEGEEERT